MTTNLCKISITIFCIAANAFAIPLKYDFKIGKKSKPVFISAVEIVPSKVTEKTLSFKNAHGKTVIRKIPVAPMDTSENGRADALKYINQIRDLVVLVNEKTKFKKDIIKQNENNKKHDNLKMIQVILKIQIQKTGRFDILSLNSANPENQRLVEQNLNGIKHFPPIPEHLELDELQLIMQMDITDLK